MKISNVLNCSFPVWYERFSKVTAESVIIDLPREFTEYLKADGVVLPECLTFKTNTTRDSDSSDSEVDWASADEDVVLAPSFPELDSKIKEAISYLGGKIYPKMNWSSPKDACWIALNKSMCCYAVRDIYLLLKSSDFVSHDLTQPFKDCSDAWSGGESAAIIDYKLILRKWIEIDPGCEFRCFVKDNELIAISQRDHTSFYGYIEKTQRDVVKDITSFYKEHLKNKFYDDDFVFDVYRKCKDEVKLIDFNPFGSITDPLLFVWEELEDPEFSGIAPEIRFVNINRGVQPSPLRQYGLPRDMVDLSTGEDPYKLMDLLSLRNRGIRHDDTSDLLYLSSSSDEEND